MFYVILDVIGITVKYAIWLFRDSF